GSGSSSGLEGGTGSARYQAERRSQPDPLPGRVECGNDQTSCVQTVSAPVAETPALSRVTMGEPQGSQAISSSCAQCTRTGRPGTARASSAASRATSSAPLWP